MSASPLRSGAKSTNRILVAFAVVSLLSLPLRCWFAFKGHAAAAVDGGFAGLAGLLEFTAIILFVGWLRTTYGTLPFFGVRTRYTPAMAVAVFLIPFSNYFRAGDVVDELIDGTDFTKLAAAARVQRVSIPIVVRSWWYFFIAGATLSNIATAILLTPGSAHESMSLVALIVVAQLLLAGSALLAVRFVETIEARMENCLARLRMSGQKDIERVIPLRLVEPSDVPFKAFCVCLVVFIGIRVFDIACAIRLWIGDDLAINLVRPWLPFLAGGVFLLTVLTFFWWVSRLATNLQAMSLTTLSPAWAVGGLFIPFFNLFHGYDVLRTMWRGVQKQAPPKPAAQPATFTIWVGAEEESTAQRPVLLTVWLILLLAAVLTSIYAQAALIFANQRDTFIALRYVGAFLTIATCVALYAAASEINEAVQPFESRFINDAQAVKRAALAAASRSERTLAQPRPDAKRASWSEVLLPIATAVDQGLASETAERRQERALADQQAAARPVLPRPRIPTKEIAGVLSNVLQVVALVAAQLAERTSRPHVPATNVIRTRILTNALRVVMLFSLLIAEVALFLYGGDSTAFHGAIVARLVALTIFVLMFGLPTWLLLAGWVFLTQRNVEAIDPWTVVTPSALAMFRLREPGVLRAIMMTTFDGISVSHERRLRTWSWSLRVVQFAPLILLVLIGTPLAPVGALVVAVALIVWCIMTAAFVREIDDGVEMLPFVIESRAPQVPGPEAPEDRPRESERGDADGGDDRPAVVGEHAGGE